MNDTCVLGTLLTVGGVTTLVLLVALVDRVRFWLAEGKRVLEPGYVPPLPGWFARFMRMTLGKLFVFLYIGKLRVIDRRHLRYKGRLIVQPNHQTERDAVLIPFLMRMRNTRYFIAKTQAGGLRAPLVAWTGGIVVEHATKRGPIAALMAAIKSMIAELFTDFVIFPQGKLVKTNELKREEWFSGVYVLGEKVSAESEMDVAHMPVGIYYDRDPSHATLFHRFMNLIGFKNFRNFFGEVVYGAVVVLGEPMPHKCLPDKKEAGTDELFNCVVTLSARAEQIGKSRGRRKAA